MDNLEVYKQAHEIRRKWENYIWQWGILLTILAAIFVKCTEPTTDFTFIQKIILSLVACYVFTIFLNVLRARVLMKELEISIHNMHIEMKNKYPIVPLELNESLSGLKNISSTKIAMFCHLVSALVFAIIAFYAWLK
jgi:hypothetical protein